MVIGVWPGGPGKGEGGQGGPKNGHNIWLQDVASMGLDDGHVGSALWTGSLNLRPDPAILAARPFAQEVLFVHFMDVRIDLSCSIASFFHQIWLPAFQSEQITFVSRKASLPRTIAKPLHACFCFSLLHGQQKISKHKSVTKTRHAAGARRRHGVSGQP